ncbi:DUF1642 domain-containing protein [Streptococcus constellatus]|uniref:DUF1642 domain-containing protein n=1 Tax=Streptococcus constellatus TaxID=76860 RepID=UPI0028ECF643|nr:DUF1642 domain-containing protein [Streptococcus constellatus]
MNKQEAIKKIDRTLSLPRSTGSFSYDYEDGLRYAKDIINQIDELEKTIVPRFVADWYEKYKDEFEYYLKGFIAKVGYEINHNTKDEFYQWLGNPHNDPILKLVNMHQFGYEVEEEKLYTARLKIITISYVNYINKRSESGAIVLGDLNTASGNYQTSFTQSELEELGIWNNPAFEIEEVE